jgi:hypothetical protein
MDEIFYFQLFFHVLTILLCDIKFISIFIYFNQARPIKIIKAVYFSFTNKKAIKWKFNMLWKKFLFIDLNNKKILMLIIEI